MSARDEVVFLVDVDNTLLDNDAVRDDVRAAFVTAYGKERAGRYWTIQERRFVELEYRDYLGAVQEWWEGEGCDARLVDAARILLDYPFAERVYPGALDALAHLRTLGPTAVVTDGEAIFQPHKIHRSGIARAVDGRVLVYVHKELVLDDVERRYPAERYVFVDDKLRILTAVKAFWRERVTTVLPLQGQFATDAEVAASHPAADITIDGIAELTRLEL